MGIRLEKPYKYLTVIGHRAAFMNDIKASCTELEHLPGEADIVEIKPTVFAEGVRVVTHLMSNGWTVILSHVAHSQLREDLMHLIGGEQQQRLYFIDEAS